MNANRKVDTDKVEVDTSKVKASVVERVLFVIVSCFIIYDPPKYNKFHHFLKFFSCSCVSNN